MNTPTGNYIYNLIQIFIEILIDFSLYQEISSYQYIPISLLFLNLYYRSNHPESIP